MAASNEYGQIAYESEGPSRLKGPIPHRKAELNLNTLLTKHVCVYCKGKHSLHECEDFILKETNERWKIVRRLKCCFSCLRMGHQVKACTNKQACQYQSCGKQHHTLLHIKITPVANDSSADKFICSSSDTSATGIQLGFVPVRLTGPNGHRLTYAFLDECSDRTLIKEGLVDDLGLERKPCSLTITTLLTY